MNNEILRLKLEEYENNIRKNSVDINKMKLEIVRQNGKIDNLCEKMMMLNESIRGLVITIKWAVGIVAAISTPVFLFLLSK